MSLIVENEIQWLTEIILPKILRNGKLLDDYNESLAETFEVKSVEINVIGVDEAYMLTICYRATIELKYAGQQLQKKLVVKKTPKISSDLYNVIQFDSLFSNEVIFYTEILPVIQELSNGKFAAPRYYYSEIKADAALIILSDFASDGWSVTKDLYGLSLEHARIAVKYLGTFHGFGFAMKHTQPERFQQLTAKLREARYAKETLSTEWGLKHKISLRRAEGVVAKYQPQMDKEFIRKFQQLVYSYIGYGRQRVAPREPLSTLCHGDYLRNNVAYKYDADSSGTPLDIMMFDYQTMRVSSPMIDLSVFLALSLLAEVRYANFDTLFDDYCNALAESYREHSKQQLPEFLSRENLLKEYIRFLPYAIHITSYFLMSLVAPPKKSPAENFESQISTKEIVQTAMHQGGELVDREIAHQLKELYELSRLHNVQIDEHIDTSKWSEEAAKFVNESTELYGID
ncbi:hypothetical protein AWZ03_010538 [Drosophila navojoa]|uniref:CHK kinase-like domain-containing protein n=1 Tax=Drosophila navojoa TaxID=7232 RepID=A0A484B2H7_DRONA|nr:uncharacterized protein LOC108655254 [Drosophila navojoa]TDG43016.1 hypothetical protein AWZ03_010538 [Drosophila navojoa]